MLCWLRINKRFKLIGLFDVLLKYIEPLKGDLKKKVFKIFFQAKKVFKIFFPGDFHLRKTKKGVHKFSARFLALSNKISTVQKIVLSSSRGQGNFRGLEASRPRTWKCVLEAKDVLEDSTSAAHFCRGSYSSEVVNVLSQLGPPPIS